MSQSITRCAAAPATITIGEYKAIVAEHEALILRIEQAIAAQADPTHDALRLRAERAEAAQADLTHAAEAIWEIWMRESDACAQADTMAERMAKIAYAAFARDL